MKHSPVEKYVAHYSYTDMFNKVLKQYCFCMPLLWMSLGAFPVTAASVVN